MNLNALLTGAEPPPPGVEVCRVRAWPSVVVTLLLIALGAWAYDYAFSGQMRSMRAKTVLGLIGWPFIVAWWAWHSFTAFRLRRRGCFGWALSDTHFGYVGTAGIPMGPWPLAAITSVTLRKPRGAGALIEIDVDGSVQHRVPKGLLNLYQLSGDELGLLVIRPSSSKALFRALAARLRAVNPKAQILD